MMAGWLRFALSPRVLITGLVVTALVMALSVGWSVWLISLIPPGPTAWHDADFGPFLSVALGLPLLVLYGHTLARWWRLREPPSMLVAVVAGLNLFLLVLVLGSTR